MYTTFRSNRIQHRCPAKAHQGFTLIETLVSMSIFTIVVTMSMGTLLVLIDANGKAQNQQSVVTNISFALDSMSREIRTGSHYYCANNPSSSELQTNDCAGGASGLAFTEAGDSLTAGLSDNRIAYRLNGTTIERQLSSGGSWVPVTGPAVVIDTLDFVVTNTDPLPDTKSPTVTIYIAATVGAIEGLDSIIEMQTTVTQQILDL